MARNGKKTGGRNFIKGQVANPGGFTKEQARAKHLTREALKDLMNTLNTATHEEMMLLLERPDTTALTMMIIKGYMNAIETGDMKQIELVLQRLVGKVKDEVDLNIKPFVIKRRNGEQVEMGAKAKDEDE